MRTLILQTIGVIAVAYVLGRGIVLALAILGNHGAILPPGTDYT